MRKLWAKIRSFFVRKEGVQVTTSNKWHQSYQDFVFDWIKTNIKIFDDATDIKKISKNWQDLTLDQKSLLLTEFIKWISYYESSWNPALYSVDVGKKEDKNTWSVGLMQMSVIDQTSYRTETKFNFEELQNGVNNLWLALLVMRRMILNRGLIFRSVGNNGYWAVIIEGGKYQKIEQILAKVQELEKTFDVEIPEPTPWMDVAIQELGVREIPGDGNNPQILKYHSVTTLKAKQDSVSWCASFACWVLETAGYKSTKSAWARDFLKYGTKLEKPKKGCIMVFERGSPGGTSHVTFWTGKENSLGYECLGGNQSDMVNRQYYPKSQLLGCVWPIK